MDEKTGKPETEAVSSPPNFASGENASEVRSNGINQGDDIDSAVSGSSVDDEGRAASKETEPLIVAMDNLPELFGGSKDPIGEELVEAEDQSETARLLSRIRELGDRLDEALRERQSLFDQLLRRQAEFDNFRKRAEREKAEVYARARAEVFADMLPVLDNFERALSHGATAEGTLADGLVQGLELVYKQFRDILAKCGLEMIPSVGEQFNPDLHDAVLTERTSAVEESTVIEELERGYRLGGKVLRPSKVKVAVRK